MLREIHETEQPGDRLQLVQEMQVTKMGKEQLKEVGPISQWDELMNQSWGNSWEFDRVWWEPPPRNQQNGIWYDVI